MHSIISKHNKILGKMNILLMLFKPNGMESKRLKIEYKIYFWNESNSYKKLESV